MINIKRVNIYVFTSVYVNIKKRKHQLPTHTDNTHDNVSSNDYCFVYIMPPS